MDLALGFKKPFNDQIIIIFILFQYYFVIS